MMMTLIWAAYRVMSALRQKGGYRLGLEDKVERVHGRVQSAGDHVQRAKSVQHIRVRSGCVSYQDKGKSAYGLSESVDKHSQLDETVQLTVHVHRLGQQFEQHGNRHGKHTKLIWKYQRSARKGQRGHPEKGQGTSDH
jgi:hypothetical protein